MVDEAQKALEEAEALKKVIHMFYFIVDFYKVTEILVLYCLHTISKFGTVFVFFLINFLLLFM